MSNLPNRDAAPRDGDSLHHRLARLQDAPFLARVVPHLPPETLHELIGRFGLEACGELVTAATPAQLAALLDLDLWRTARPGRDHRLDVDRFGEWLELLADTGGSIAARTVAALDEDVVVAGLARYVRVFDPGIFEPTAQSDDETTDRHEAMREGDSLAVADSLECEVGGYFVRARRADTWDAVVTLLVALADEQGDCFHAVMRGCQRLSNSRPEIDGLDDLLRAPEQHHHEVAVDRERRRSQQGYATPADARAFLQMARCPGPTRSAGATAVNPLVTAYFRAADEASPSPASRPTAAPDGATGVAEPIAAVVDLLTEAGLTAEWPRGQLAAADAGAESGWLPHLRPLLEHLRDAGDTAHVRCSRELAFLANVLLAGCSVQGRSFTPREASDAAASICNLGLEHWRAGWPPIDHDLVTAFEVGWSVLHRDVSVFAAQQLVETLADLHCADAEIQRELAAFQRVLAKHRDRGTPWLARSAADVLAMLDVTAWTGVRGLLGECPVLPEALTAILEGRTRTVSPTAFAFISTAAQIGEVRAFMRRLPDALAG